MTREEFERLLHRQPAVAFEITKALCACLHDADNASIRDLQAKNWQLARAYEDLKRAQAQIIEKEKLEHELLLAREIQESILPRTLPAFWGFDFGARMVPAKAVGGDFFDFIPLDDHSLGIAVGDVSDKGVPSALFMAMTRSFLRAEARRSLTPLEVLRGVNRHLMELNDAGMFVTVLYGVLHFPTRRFRYVRAGHTLPILCGSDGSTTVPPRALSHPLAVLHEPAFDEQSVDLPPDSLMLAYTDGLTEATNDRQELYGGERLHQVLRAHRARPARELCDRIVRAVLDYQAEAPLHDDITLVAVRSPP
jgi:sigma-B regulation protein RsbU (phosphoserine phosphatase)